MILDLDERIKEMDQQKLLLEQAKIERLAAQEEAE